VHVRAVVVAVLLSLLAAAAAHAPARVAPVAHAQVWAPVLVPVPVPVAVAAAPATEPRLLALGGLEEARRWARGRAGTVGFAVADEGGRVRGLHLHHRFFSASVVKAMLALAVVRSARDRALTAGERALLRPMITVSDNASASTVYARIGAAPLHRIARAAGMTRFSIGGNWADALLTPHDQARLFLRIDRLAPRRHREYLRGLLASIVPWQRWGIAPVAEERGFHIMFKGGWRTNIFHQVALLERDDRRVALAVLTSGTGQDDGRETQSGIAARVLSRPPRRPVAGGPE
jgi:Beta-lactamase enzyme family